MKADDCPKTMPVVSVIVLSYNHAATVAQALDSVLAMALQCPAVEIVVGDDGSTDGCYEICAEYAARYPDMIRLMPRCPNMGVVENYFRCLRECRGEFVTDCAADDRRLPGQWLKKQIEMLRANSSLVAVGSDWVELRDGKEVCSDAMANHAQWRQTVEGRTMLLDVLGSAGSFPVPLTCMLYRRSAVDASNPMVCNPRFGCEDLPLVCALGAAGDFGFVPEPSLFYIVDSGSISNAGSPARLLGFYYKALVCRLTLAPYYHATAPRVRYSIDHGLRFVAGLAFDSGKREWIENVKGLLRTYPYRVPLGVRLKMMCAGCRPLWRLFLGSGSREEMS